VQAVERYVRPFRAMTAAPPSGPVIPATRKITRWLMSRPATLGDKERAQLAGILDRCPHLGVLAGHVRSFAEMMTCRQGEHQLEGWLTRVGVSDLPELRSFANGIRRDQQAVTAGLTLPYSSAAVEGTVTIKVTWNLPG
jgi:transposase